MKKFILLTAIALSANNVFATKTLPDSCPISIVSQMDYMQYGHYIGMKWMATNMVSQCKDASVSRANLRALKAKAEEMQMYVDYKLSTNKEVYLSNKILQTIKVLEKDYLEKQDEQSCMNSLSIIGKHLSEVLEIVSGKND